MMKANAKEKPFAKLIVLSKIIVKPTKNFSNYAQFRLTNKINYGIIYIQRLSEEFKMYEINIVNNFQVKTYILKTERAKNKFLAEYFMNGEGKGYGREWYLEHYNTCLNKPLTFKKFILNKVKILERIRLRDYYLILIRKK
jgi:NAD-specific glutamate dehydrogenase